MKLSSCTINVSDSLKNALIKLNDNHKTLTLFVLDQNKLIGTLTDGDIRRGLINGLDINSSIDAFMYRNFSYLNETSNSFTKLKEFRNRMLKAVPMLNSSNEIVRIYDFTEIKSILPVDAVIMAGGKGERLLPLTLKTPKPLLKVGNKAIIEYNLDRLAQFGINNLYVTVNYLAEQILEFCNNYKSNIDITIIKEQAFLGTAGALGLVNDFKNDAILLMNSDLLTNLDYEDFYKTFIDEEVDMMVASIPYKVDLPYAIFETDDRNVKSFKEKPSYTYYANAGIYLMKKEVVSDIPENKVFNATDLMNKVVNEGKKLLHYPIMSYWLDIGNHDDFNKAQRDIAHIVW